MSISLPITLETAQGIWKRRYLTTSNHRDTTTDVTWIQAGNMHIDLRLSDRFRQLPNRSLYQQEPSSLLEIADLVAFAGNTSIVDSVCTWTRQINFCGPQADEDVGVLSWSDETLIERGVHDDYEEGWELEDTGPGQARCFSGKNGQRLFLCFVSNRFAMARAHPMNMQETLSMSDRVNNALEKHDERQLSKLFDQEFCFGEIVHGNARILRSSNPSRVGACVFQIDGPLAQMDSIEILQEDFLGQSKVHRYAIDVDSCVVA